MTVADRQQLREADCKADHPGMMKAGKKKCPTCLKTLVEAADSMAKANTPEPFSTSKTSNWVARSGGLPAYIQHVAHDIHEKRGKSTSNAIQIAIGVVKRWAKGVGNVDSGTRAAAAKAWAQWQALKARNAASKVSESLALQLQEWEDAGDAMSASEFFEITESLYSEAKHPRGRGGKWIDVLGRLNHGESHTSMSGVTAKLNVPNRRDKSIFDTFTVHAPGHGSRSFDGEEAAAKHAASLEHQIIGDQPNQLTLMDRRPEGAPSEPKSGTPEFKAAQARTRKRNVERYGKADAHTIPDRRDTKPDAGALPRRRVRRDALGTETTTWETPKPKEPSETPDFSNSSISDIAGAIHRDWGPKVNFAAKPYLDAMHSLNTMNDKFGLDDAASVVSYFLSNASGHRGPVAKAAKAELRKRVKKHYGRLREAEARHSQAHIDHVKRIQAAVGAKVDGKMGSETRTKVRSFQKSHGLHPDGVVGHKTIAKVREHVSNSPHLKHQSKSSFPSRKNSTSRDGSRPVGGDSKGAKGAY